MAPDKLTAFEESLLSLAPTVLSYLKTPIPVVRLRSLVGQVVRNPSDFVLVLDILFVLGSIEVDFATGDVSRVD